MRPTRLVALVVLSLAGCKTCSHCEKADSHCERGDQDSIVFQAPQQKVIVEQPAPGAGAPAPTVGVPTTPVGYPQVGAPMGYGAPMTYGAPPGGTIRERTGLGLVFDHLEIRIPWIRLIAVPKPTEVTYHLPPAPPVAYGYPPPQMPVGYPPPQMPVAYPPPQPCQPPVGAAPPVAAPPPVAAAPVSEQQCDEIIQKCHILKGLHQLKQRAAEAACPKMGSGN